MADSFKMIAIILAITMMLYIGGSISGSSSKLFGQDLFDTWMKRDVATNEYYSFSSNFTNASSKIDNPSTAGSITGSSSFNFIDVIQMGIGFLQLIANLIFTIPMALLNMAGLPYMLRFVIIVPLVILGGVIIFLMLVGRK